MKKIRRTRRSIDLGKLASAITRPGVDPRVWITLGVVTETGADPEQGLFADVEFIPSGEEQTVFVGSNYAGAGYGTVVKPKVGDVVVIAVPEGIQDAGPIIIARLWNGQMPPPPEAINGEDITDDVVTRVKSGDSHKLFVGGGGGVLVDVDGAGDIRLQARGSGKVKLGDTDLQPAVLGNANQSVLDDHETRIKTLETAIGQFVTAFSTHTHVVTVSGVTVGVASAGGVAAVPAAFSPPAPVPQTAPETRATDTEVK